MVIHHEKQPAWTEDLFLISWLARRWREWGLDVRHMYGTDDFPSGDLAILHVDLSVVPDSYLELARHYPRRVNFGLTDIRKRKVSRNLVGKHDDYRGPVVVKTDLNHGGTPESLIGILRPPPPLTWLQRCKRRLGIKDPRRIRVPADYIVYERKTRVPSWVFDDPSLVVERFLPERHGDDFYHRRYLFFGEAERNEIWAGPVPLHASDGTTDRYWTEPVPPGLRELRSAFSADYGKIDYVLREGQVVLLDVNRTPTGSVSSRDPVDARRTREVADSLAQGIRTWLK